MTRKTTNGPVRNKERTKKKLIEAVGKVLTQDGFAALNVSQVAAKAKVNRKLVYEYFGGMEELIREYLNGKDFYRFEPEQTEQIIEQSRSDFGKSMMNILLERQFDQLMGDDELRRIITWGLCENSKPLQELNDDREALAELLFSNVTDNYFKDRDKNIRAVEAILISGIYYLSLYPLNGTSFCGIDIKGAEGQAEIKKTLKQIIDWAYS